MTLEDQIAALLQEAAPLRCLPEDDPAALPLAGIVDRINALRAVQATAPVEVPAVLEVAVVKRGPGRPRKAD